MTLHEFNDKLFQKLLAAGEVEEDDYDKFMTEAHLMRDPFGIFLEIVNEAIEEELHYDQYKEHG